MAAEKNFENKIKKFLTEQNCWFVKYFANGYTKAGIPDILCCCNGKFIGIEVKAENGHPSELQIHHLTKIDDAEGYSILLYPEDFELFKNFILCLKADDPNAKHNYKLLKRRWKNNVDNSR